MAAKWPDFPTRWPREESNLRTRIRSPSLYPLSYGARLTRKGGGWDSNPRPPGPQPGALPTELPPPRSAYSLASGSSARLAPNLRDVAPHVLTLGEFLDHLLVERRNVVRLAARDDSVVDDDFLVDPVSARVANVRLERRPRRDGAAARDSRL